MDITDSVQEVITAVSQEILALVFFAISFWIFKCLNGRRAHLIKNDQALRLKKKAAFSESSPKSLARSNTVRAENMEKVQAAEAQIMNMLEAREFTAALNAYRGYEREGFDRYFTNEAMYSGFIQSAVRVGKIDVVERMLRIMSRNRLSPSVNFWHSTLKMLSSRKHYSSCLLVFASYGHMLPNDKVIFSCLINAALEHGATDKAVPMLRRYQKCDLEPADYITAFRIHVALNDAEAAEKLFLQMEGDMTPLMLNLVLLACINAQQPERAMAVLQKAHEVQAEASGNVKIVDTISYNTVIKGFVASGHIDSCISCLEDMQKRSLKPDDVTLTSLLEISFTDKTGRITDRLVTILLETDRTMDVGTCNLFIKGLIRVDRLQKALQIYARMQSSPECQPTIVTYSILIKASVDGHDLEYALHLVDDMGKAGIAPDEIIFTTLLDGCRIISNQELGDRIFEDMLAAGVKPSEYTLTMLVKLHGKCGAHEKAYKLVEGWEAEHGAKPSVIHYTCIMSGCLRSKSYGLAWNAYQLMEKHNVAPDEMLMTTLIPAMAASGCFDRVLHLARRALKRPGGVRVPISTLKSVLGQMMANPGAEKYAEELQVLMQVSGLTVGEIPPRWAVANKQEARK